MVSSDQAQGANKWLHDKLAAVSKDKTVALLVDQSEVKDQSLECLSHMSGNAQFRADLDLSKCIWIYTKEETPRRCLVIQHTAVKQGDSDSEEKIAYAKAKNMRGLAATAWTTLTTRKISDVEIIASSKIDVSLLGVFYNSFYLSNWEHDAKGKVEGEEKKADDGEEVDPRTKRTKRAIIRSKRSKSADFDL